MEPSYDELMLRLRAHRPAERAAFSKRSAVAVVLRPCGPSAEVLLMIRAPHERDPWSGHVSLPGGRLDPGDADLLATALRETREEVGLDLAREAELICRLEPVQVGAQGRMLDLDATPFVFRAKGELAPTPGPEASELFWLPLGEAAAGRLDHQHELQREGQVRRYPAWRLEQRVVWGLTWKVLTNLLAIGLTPPTRRGSGGGQLG